MTEIESGAEEKIVGLKRQPAVSETPAEPHQLDAARLESTDHTVKAKALRYREQRITCWDNYLRKRSGNYYHTTIRRTYKFLIPAGHRVLELGCGTGDLLAALQPSIGVGIDFSPVMTAQARERYPELTLIMGDVHELDVSGRFDYVILSDLVNDLWDVQKVLERIAGVCDPHTRIIINTYSRLWELPLATVRRFGLANPQIGQNWLTVPDLKNILYLAGFETIRHWEEILCPFPAPILHTVCNRYLVRTFPFRLAALANFLIARTRPHLSHRIPQSEARVSVIIPARNEAGNIDEILRRVPEMGAGTKVLFVEGHSNDNTYDTIVNAQSRYPERSSRVLKQIGTGKADAVRTGFAAAAGDILMILDADLTVAPEDLPRFYRALCACKGEFINGVRLVYPMEKEAMRFFNLVGNKFFSVAFSWLLGQQIKDTLCGTKVLSKTDYERIAQNRAYFGDFDPFGDFELLFGASKLRLKIVDVPVRYAERTYGQTNISRWKHGLLLLRMLVFASRRIKFF
jgi:ubiquinone/menaquinone biosynthesis C-methylase UbiE